MYQVFTVCQVAEPVGRQTTSVWSIRMRYRGRSLLSTIALLLARNAAIYLSVCHVSAGNSLSTPQ